MLGCCCCCPEEEPIHTEAKYYACMSNDKIYDENLDTVLISKITKLFSCCHYLTILGSDKYKF